MAIVGRESDCLYIVRIGRVELVEFGLRGHIPKVDFGAPTGEQIQSIGGKSGGPLDFLFLYWRCFETISEGITAEWITVYTDSSKKGIGSR